MNRQLLLIAGLCLVVPVFGQSTKPTYLNAFFEPCKRGEATYVKTFTGMDGMAYTANVTTKNGTLKMEGEYVDADMRIEHGEFVFYHASGRVESRGNYVMGHKSGVWHRFDDRGQELAEKVYDHTPLEEIVYSRAERMPKYPGGDDQLMQYLSTRLNAGTTIPKGAMRASFVVEKDGDLSQMKVIDSLGDEVDVRTIEALDEMPPWDPGMEAGQAVRVRMELALEF